MVSPWYRPFYNGSIYQLWKNSSAATSIMNDILCHVDDELWSVCLTHQIASSSPIHQFPSPNSNLWFSSCEKQTTVKKKRQYREFSCLVLWLEQQSLGHLSLVLLLRALNWTLPLPLCSENGSQQLKSSSFSHSSSPSFSDCFQTLTNANSKSFWKARQDFFISLSYSSSHVGILSPGCGATFTQLEELTLLFLVHKLWNQEALEMRNELMLRSRFFTLTPIFLSESAGTKLNIQKQSFMAFSAKISDATHSIQELCKFKGWAPCDVNKVLWRVTKAAQRFWAVCPVVRWEMVELHGQANHQNYWHWLVCTQAIWSDWSKTARWRQSNVLGWRLEWEIFGHLLASGRE